MASQDSKLSTSALARKLDIPVQQLFTALKDHGWISRSGDNWILTPKGEYEGGTYRKSQRYGSYIVWPENLEQHPLLAAIESNQRITADAMGQYYPRLHARQINRALAELGLQRHTILGWELTARGRALGGQQDESRHSGALYATWPHEIIDDPVIHRELSLQSDQFHPAQSEQVEPDLFAGGASGTSCRGIDGHELASPLQTRVCNWLYLAQLAHAHHRALPTEELVYADFYLPQGSVYIDCWEKEVAARDLSAKLHRRELYREQELSHLEVSADEADRLEEVLGQGLLQFGIRC